MLSYRPKGLYVGGKWLPGSSAKSLVTINPATGERLAEVPWAGGEEVKLAVEAAKRGFAEWRRLPPWDRASQVQELADRISEHVDELALMDSYDSGNTISGMRNDVKASVVALKFYLIIFVCPAAGKF